MSVEFSLIEAAFSQELEGANFLTGWKRKGKRQYVRSRTDVTQRIELTRFKHSFPGNQIVGVRACVSFPCKIEPYQSASSEEYSKGIATVFAYLTHRGGVTTNPAFSSGATSALKDQAAVEDWAQGLGGRVSRILVPWLEERETTAAIAARCVEGGTGIETLHIVLSQSGSHAARKLFLNYLASCIAEPDARPNSRLFRWATSHGLIPEWIALALERASIQARDRYVSDLKQLVADISRAAAPS
jgi:hypothetical protein